MGAYPGCFNTSSQFLRRIVLCELKNKASSYFTLGNRLEQRSLDIDIIMNVTLLQLVKALLTAPVVYLLLRLVQYIYSLYKANRAVLQWPGLRPHWLYGNMYQHMTFDPEVRKTRQGDKVYEWVKEMTARFPHGYYFIFTWLRPVLLGNHPDIVREILKRGDGKPYDQYKIVRPWLGDGLLLSSGKKWARNRRLLTPAFHFDILKSYISLYHDAADELIVKMTHSAKNGKTFDIFKNISLCTLDILLRCAFSQETGCQQMGDKLPYVMAVHDLSTGAMDRYFTWYYLMFDFFYNRSTLGRKFHQDCDFVHNVADEVIKKRKQELKNGENQSTRKYIDFLDILLSARDDDGTGLTDLEIRNEVDTFLAEGHDTSATGLTWMLYCFAKYPEYQSKAQEEIDTIMDGKERLEWDDLANLKYLSMCIRESLRQYPPVASVGRETENEIIIDGKKLPTGSTVLVSVFQLHHNPEVWNNPSEFNPDRFLPENCQKRDPFAFLPFVAGARNCIGQHFAMHEIKVILAHILMRFELTLDPNHVVHFAQELLLKPANEVKVILKLRNQNINE